MVTEENIKCERHLSRIGNHSFDFLILSRKSLLGVLRLDKKKGALKTTLNCQSAFLLKISF